MFQPPIPSDSPEQLANAITELAAHLSAARYRFLVLVREFDTSCGWHGAGLRCCAHWLNWQCGIAMGAARENVRVAHALAELPLISQAFERGSISYSKVRAMTRIATPENEDYLLMLAQHGTAEHVERVVRGFRQVGRDEALAREHSSHAHRELDWYQDGSGSVVIRGRLPAEAGALVVKALERAQDELFAERAGCADETDDEPAANRPAAARRADALVRVAERCLAREAVKASGGDRYLVHMELTHETPAHESPMHEAPTHEANNDHDSSLEGTLADGTVLSNETTERMSCDCAVIRFTPDSPTTNHPHTHPALDIGRKSRSIPPAMRRALERRDGGCRFPGCTAHRFTDAHHIVHWARGGETSLANLITLCRHHHRLVHEGGAQVHAKEDSFAFFDRNGMPISPAPPTRSRGNVDALLEQNASLGIHPTTIVPNWTGESLDLGMAVEGLLGDLL